MVLLIKMKMDLKYRQLDKVKHLIESNHILEIKMNNYPLIDLSTDICFLE